MIQAIGPVPAETPPSVADDQVGESGKGFAGILSALGATEEGRPDPGARHRGAGGEGDVPRDGASADAHSMTEPLRGEVEESSLTTVSVTLAVVTEVIPAGVELLPAVGPDGDAAVGIQDAGSGESLLEASVQLREPHPSGDPSPGLVQEAVTSSSGQDLQAGALSRARQFSQLEAAPLPGAGDARSSSESVQMAPANAETVRRAMHAGAEAVPRVVADDSHESRSATSNGETRSESAASALAALLDGGGARGSGGEGGATDHSGRGDAPLPISPVTPPDAEVRSFASIEGALRSEVGTAQRPETSLPAMRPEAVSAQLTLLADQGGGTARIRLHPAHLGEIDIRVSVRGSAVEVLVVAAEAAGRAAMEDQRAALSQALGDRSLQLEQIEVRGGHPDGGPDWAGTDPGGGRSRQGAGNDGSDRGTHMNVSLPAAGPDTNGAGLLPSMAVLEPTSNRIDVRV